jgi:hypothetical protein
LRSAFHGAEQANARQCEPRFLIRRADVEIRLRRRKRRGDAHAAAGAPLVNVLGRGSSTNGDAHRASRFTLYAIHPNRVGGEREHCAEFRRRCVRSNHSGQHDRHGRARPDYINA